MCIGKMMALLCGGVVALFCLGAAPAEAAIINDLQQVTAVVSSEDYRMLSERVNSHTRLYRVEEGDSVAWLARRFQVEADLLMAMNDLQGNDLVPGRFLILPVAEGESYRVVRGDTLWGIAQRFGTSVERLMEVNGIGDPRSLSAGTLLTIPGNAAPLRSGERRYLPASSRGSWPSFGWPLKGVITSNYGWRGDQFHHGLDIAATTGTAIAAPAAGWVTFAGWKSDVYGGAVVIDHGHGLKSLYAHISANLVHPGEYVRPGDIIARVGDSGRATGPHLHFEVWRDNQALNPLSLLE